MDGDGICLFFGGSTVELYGDIFVEKAGADGFAFNGVNFAVTAKCSLTLFDNEEEFLLLTQTRVVSHLNWVPPQRLALTRILTLRELVAVALVLSRTMGRMSSVTMLQVLELSTAMKTVSSNQDCRRLDLPQLAWVTMSRKPLLQPIPSQKIV